MARRILVAAGPMAALLEFSLAERGFTVIRAPEAGPDDAPCDLLVADLGEGLDLLRKYRGGGGKIPAILISSHPPSLAEREEILRLGALHLGHPFEDYALFEKVCEALP